jgi:hypothetical protein
MSQMIDMKNKKRSKKELEAECMPICEQDQYPYGLQINFETEQYDKLSSLDTLKPGDIVNIVAVGSVTRQSMDEKQNGKDHKSCTIQIEQIAVDSSKKKLESMNMREYRKAREEGK